MAAAVALLVYAAMFGLTVKVGHASYGLVGDETERGGIRYYWFSANEESNQVLRVFFAPVLYRALGLKDYSYFPTHSALRSWAEKGNDVFMDDVDLVQ